MSDDIGKSLADFSSFAANIMTAGLKIERTREAIRNASEMASAWIRARNGLCPDETLLREFARMGVALVDAVVEECAKSPGVQGLTKEQLAELLAKQPAGAPDWVSEVLAKEGATAGAPQPQPQPQQEGAG